MGKKIGLDADLPSLPGTSSQRTWGSDLVVDLLSELGIEFVSLLPGSTTRGIHDSLVNHRGNRQPQIILCNHEMITVSIARGYARVTGKPMAALVHNVVGLLNTEMTIYDAWCDRTPVIVIGGTGPVDSQKRRPRTDWIHTANIQGNLVRDFTKWDDQPASLNALNESLLRAYRIAVTEPKGPVYVCVDVELQEKPLSEGEDLPNVSRYEPARPQAPNPEGLAEASDWLVGSNSPVVFADRLGRSPEAFHALVELAELLALPVVDMGNYLSFPTPHPLDFVGLSDRLVGEADLVLGLDAANLFSATRSTADYTSRASEDIAPANQRVVSISLDEYLHRGFAADYRGLPAVDLPLLGDTSLAIPMLLEACKSRLDSDASARIDRRRERLELLQAELRVRQQEVIERSLESSSITETRLLYELWDVIRNEEFVITSGPSLPKMTRGILHLDDPKQYVSGGGGGAVGSSPGVAVGAALGLMGTGKVPVAILGDGAFLGSIQVLWTAAHYGIPSLIVVNNNRSYYNDEAHQELVAQFRNRPLENAWIGQRMENPTVDFATISSSFGVVGEGPIRDAGELRPAFERALKSVKGGQLAVVDVWTENRGRP